MQNGSKIAVESNEQQARFYDVRKQIADIVDLYKSILNDESKLKAYRKMGGAWSVLDSKVKSLSKIMDKNIDEEDEAHLKILESELSTQNAYIKRMEIRSVAQYSHQTPLGEALFTHESQKSTLSKPLKKVTSENFDENSKESMFDKISISSQKALDKNKPLFSNNLKYEVIAKKLQDFDLKWDSLRYEFRQTLLEKKAFTEADISKFKEATESLKEINKELEALSLPAIQQVSSDLLTNYNSALEQSGWWGKKQKIQDADFAIEDAFKDVAYSRIQVSNFVSDRISRQQNSLNQTIKKSEAEEKRQPTLTVKPSPIKVSKNNQPSEGVTAKSLMNLAEKSLEMPLLGLPLACAFFVASKICDAINFIGSKINSPEKIMPTAKGSEEAYPLASPLAFGSHIMNQQSGNSKTYETSGYAL